MPHKRILLADADAGTLAVFRQSMGDEWQVTPVANGNAALAEMEKEPTDVVVADLNLVEVDGGELLNRIQTAYPKATRFILARETDQERMVKQVLGAHQFLGKPLDASKLKNVIEGACALESWIPRNSIRELVRRIRTLPTMPTLHQEVLTLLKSPNATTEQVGAIIAKDMAMMTKLLQVLNSAWFGASRKITDPAEAVGILGFETVSSMVMTIKLLSQYDKVKPVYFSIDRLWRHSTEVAKSAKQIALLHTNDQAMAEAAFTGGLLHDLGKVVLASNFDEQYSGAQSLARKQKLAPWEVEKEIFGASHGEIGAYLLGLWGMPVDVLEVAALHHHPSRQSKKEFTPLTAVHMANAFAYEMNPEKEGVVVATIDENYLGEIGVLEHLNEWREAIANRKTGAATAKPKPISATVSKPASTPTPAMAPRTPLPGTAPAHAAEKKAPETPWTFYLNRWVYGGVTAVACGILLAWFAIGPIGHSNEKTAPLQVNARTDNASVTTVSEIKPAAIAQNPPPQSSLQSVSSAISKSAPAPETASASTPVNASVPPPTKPVAANSNPGEPKLQGIFFSSAHPSAIINGKLVEANDVVGAVRVIEIYPSSVTVEYQNQRKTLRLK